MMKTTLKHFFFALTLVFIASNSFAQIQLLLDDDNVPSFLTYLQQKYPAAVGITQDVLQAFVDQQADGPVEIAALSIDEILPTGARLSWESNGDGPFLIRALHLGNGTQTDFTADMAEATIDLDAALYLVGVERFGMLSQSTTTYIVVDKNILAYQLGVLNNCNCENPDIRNISLNIAPTTAYGNPFPHFAIVNWDNDGSNYYEYKIIVNGDYLNQGQNTSYMGRFFVGHNAYPYSEIYALPAWLQQSCHLNTNVDTSSPFHMVFEDPGKFEIFASRNNLMVHIYLDKPELTIMRCDVQSVGGVPGVIIFPNPSQGLTTIEYSLAEDASIVDLTILDLFGSVWHREAIAENANAGTYLHTFDTSDWPEGQYFAHITDGENIQTAKFEKVE